MGNRVKDHDVLVCFPKLLSSVKQNPTPEAISTLKEEIQKFPAFFNTKAMLVLCDKIIAGPLPTPDLSAIKLHELSDLFDKQLALHAGRAHRGNDRKTTFDLHAHILNAIADPCADTIQKIRTNIQQLPIFYDQRSMLALLNSINSDAQPGQVQALQSDSVPAPETEFKKLITAKAGKQMDTLSANDIVKLLHSHRHDHALINVLKDSIASKPRFLIDLSLSDSTAESTKIILTSRLGLRLSNAQIAELLYHFRLTLHPKQQGQIVDIPDYLRFIESLIKPCRRSLLELIEDPAANTFLLKSSIYQHYQDYINVINSKPSYDQGTHRQTPQDAAKQQQQAQNRTQISITNYIENNIDLYEGINQINKNNPSLLINASTKTEAIATVISKARKAINLQGHNKHLSEEALKKGNSLIDDARDILLNAEYKRQYDTARTFHKPHQSSPKKP